MCIFPEFRSALWDKITIHHIPDSVQAAERQTLIDHIKLSYIRGLYEGAAPELAERTLIKAYSGEYNVHITMHERIGAFERWAKAYPGSPGPKGVQSGPDIYMGADLLIADGNLKPALRIDWLDTSKSRTTALHENGHTLDLSKQNERFTLRPEYKAAYSQDEFHVMLMHQIYKVIKKTGSFTISPSDEIHLEKTYQRLKADHLQKNTAEGAPQIHIPATLANYISAVTPDAEYSNLNGYLTMIQGQYLNAEVTEPAQAIENMGRDINTAYHHVLFPKPPADIKLPANYTAYTGFNGRCRESIARFIDLEHSQTTCRSIRQYLLPHIKQQVEEVLYPEIAEDNYRSFQQPETQAKRAGAAEALYDYTIAAKAAYNLDGFKISMESNAQNAKGDILMQVKGSTPQEILTNARITRENMEKRSKGTMLEGCALKVKYDHKTQKHCVAIEGLDQSFAQQLRQVVKRNKQTASNDLQEQQAQQQQSRPRPSTAQQKFQQRPQQNWVNRSSNETDGLPGRP